MGGLGVKVQHFPLTLLVVLTTLTLPCERDTHNIHSKMHGYFVPPTPNSGGNMATLNQLFCTFQDTSTNVCIKYLMKHV